MAAECFAANRVEPASSARCASCGQTHFDADWPTLTLLRRLGPDELRAYVDPWPAHLVVEARACRRCRAPMSRVRA